ncbi:MAG: PAS domain-containing protein [Alphaproteobacteria bacterium]|nr:PAS domain-containing protein [Alphaproteobacteria bacterium]
MGWRDTEKDEDIPYLFAERVLTVSLPTALMLLILVLAEEVQPVTAVVGFGMVVCLTIVLALPFLRSLKNLTRYVHKLAQDEDISDMPVFSKRDEESVRIVAAINQMRNIWATKTEHLEAQTLSDAAVLDSLPDPLLMLDEEGVVIGANLAARELFGFNVRGQSLKTLVESQYLPLALDRILNEQTRKENLEIFLKQKVFNAKIEHLPAEARAGAVAVLSLYDMTERKQFEQMQTDFIANASHELRTPLSVLSGFVETLQGMPDEDKEARNHFLGIMQTQAGRMSALIESLLCLSRLQMNEKRELSEQIDIPEMLPVVKQMLDAKAVKTEMNIVLKPCAQSGKILGNTSELNQVFQNLTDNALKYGKPGGKVTVSCRVLPNNGMLDEKAPQIYAVSVHNTGNPIAPENLPHLFERFYRVAETKNKAVGTGLGLSIVEQIVKHHNGQIKVESSIETGTVFTVYLPMYPLDSSEETSGSETTEQPVPADSELP